MPESPFDQLADRYDVWYDTEGRLAFEIELAALRPLLADCPRPWLEIGVGTGRFAQALGIPLGIDPSAALLEKARQRGIEVLWGEGEELVFHAGSFGTVFLLTTWEFLSDPARVLGECRRVLRPGGRLVNAYLDRRGRWAARYIEKAEAGHPLFSHARFDDFEQVFSLTEQAGFRVVQTVSTLFQGPEDTAAPEEPRPGYVKGASFVVVVAAWPG
ncbi:class I SAM-dependent methyltransferase [candidate division WOR-3 bacterium]|nr:class I SAM-dependent methyltransferase [candidate division WOR-3 bacterium]